MQCEVALTLRPGEAVDHLARPSLAAHAPMRFFVTGRRPADFVASWKQWKALNSGRQELWEARDSSCDSPATEVKKSPIVAREHR